MIVKHKYRVCDKADRTWNSVVYDSKAEMEYAQQLDLLRRGGLYVEVLRQVPIVLSRGITVVVDFRCERPDRKVEWLEVKGMETPTFRLKLRLWLEHGPGPLHIIKKKRGKFVVDRVIVPGGKMPRRVKKNRNKT